MLTTATLANICLVFGKRSESLRSFNTGPYLLRFLKNNRIEKSVSTSTEIGMRSLDRLTLRVPDVEACCSFYEQMLGMSSIPTGLAHESATTSNRVLCFASNPKGLKLTFIEPRDDNAQTTAGATSIGSSTPTSTDVIKSCTPRQSTSKDAFWKIGITVKHLDSAVAFLQKQGVSVSKPAQFQDIGYLCHLRDPAGMSIELLQHAFQGKEDAISDEDSSHLHPIGHQGTVAHITIRATNLPKLQQWCTKDMEMQLLSIQPVPDYEFTLYFYSWPSDLSTMPNPSNLKAVENRPWLWARPYGLIEIQHLENESAKLNPLRPTSKDEAGPVELLVVETNGEESKEESVFCRINCSQDLGL